MVILTVFSHKISAGESEDEDDSLVSQGSRNAVSTISHWEVARRRAALSVSRPSSRVRLPKRMRDRTRTTGCLGSTICTG